MHAHAGEDQALGNTAAQQRAVPCRTPLQEAVRRRMTEHSRRTAATEGGVEEEEEEAADAGGRSQDSSDADADDDDAALQRVARRVQVHSSASS